MEDKTRGDQCSSLESASGAIIAMKLHIQAKQHDEGQQDPTDDFRYQVRPQVAGWRGRCARRLFRHAQQEENPEAYRLASPLVHLDKQDPPCWLITGETDDPSTHGDVFRAKQQALGIASGLTVIPGAPHGFVGKQGWFDQMIESADGFFKQTLQ